MCRGSLKASADNLAHQTTLDYTHIYFCRYNLNFSRA